VTQTVLVLIGALIGLVGSIDVQAPTAIAPPTTYAGLPNVTGYTPEQVKTSVGLPVVVRISKTGVTSWLYATPDGDRFIYFVNGHATMMLPTKSREAAPAAIPGCAQAPEARTVIVLSPNTPVYSAPRVRPEAVDRLAAGTALPVLRTAGAWFAVSLGGIHAAYVHCSDVHVSE